MPPVKAAKKNETTKAESKADSKADALKDALTKDREVIYPDLRVNGVPIPLDALKVTVQMAKDFLHWETEEEFKARTKSDAGFGDTYMLKDEYGRKVNCWNNLRNRPYDDATARKYAQDILDRKWAGPANYDGETVNGETIIIGRTGLDESGQHRLIGLVLASQIREKNEHYLALWPEEPFLESLVVTGVSEHPSIIQTLDNVRPRILSDVFYTSGVFDDINDLSSKKELSRMLDAAVDMLWVRTGAGKASYLGGDKLLYQTHSTSREFVDRHPKILECVRHIFEENSDRQLSTCRLNSPGMCAAALYLMGSSASDPDKYHDTSSDAEPSSEKVLKWKAWNAACEFWVALAGGNEEFQALRDALIYYHSDEDAGGRMAEKLMVIAKAWAAFSGDKSLTFSVKEGESPKGNLALDYEFIEGRGRVLKERPGFGGIDLGPRKPADPKKDGDDSGAETRQAKERKKKKPESNAAPAPPTPSLEDELMALRKQHPDTVLLFERGNGYNAWQEDAKIVSKHAKVPVKTEMGLPAAAVQAQHLDAAVSRMMAAGITVAICNQHGAGAIEVRVVETDPLANGHGKPRAKPAVPKANGKPPAKPAPAKKPAAAKK